MWLGVSHWRAAPVDLSEVAPGPKSARTVFLRGLLVSLTNPKTLFFYGAFFPQFVDAARPVGPQVAVLAASFLVLAMTIDSGWALAAGRARGLIARRGRLRNRLTGGLLIGAGAALALARRR